MSDTDDIIALERRRCEALSSGDVDAFAAMLTDDYLHAHANGRITDRDATLDNMRRRPRKVERGELHVRLYGDDTAVLTGPMMNDMPGEPQPPGFSTQVLRKIDGQWKFVSFHTSRPAGA